MVKNLTLSPWVGNTMGMEKLIVIIA